MSKVNVRYIVNDVDAAIPFYTDMLGFKVEMHPAPGFASLSRGDLQLLLNRPGAGGAGQALRDGQSPAPGGWNRIQIEVEDIEATVNKLKNSGGRAFATISSPATAASKFSSRIRPAIRSSCFSPFNRMLEPRPKHRVVFHRL
jgi:catechol 2,3-dioxygenase-like lactoylglutathione lyase family enzyme